MAASPRPAEEQRPFRPISLILPRCPHQGLAWDLPQTSERPLWDCPGVSNWRGGSTWLWQVGRSLLLEALCLQLKGTKHGRWRVPGEQPCEQVGWGKGVGEGGDLGERVWEKTMSTQLGSRRLFLISVATYFQCAWSLTDFHGGVKRARI